MDTLYDILLLAGAIVCAWRAVHARRILGAALYLAGVSACVASVLYLLGAHEVAVIELSVGAGLVTVLLVYALSVVGEDALDPASIIPKPLAFAAILACALLLLWLALPASAPAARSATGSVNLSETLWHVRVLDVWVQVALIFSGVMGVLGLLSEQPAGRSEAH